jgi:transposase-like protein
VALVPRWDSAGDIGKSEKVSSFVCVGCQASFSREEGEQLQATEAERVRLRVRLMGEAERLDKQ